jgi:hypothetical protein
MSVVRQALYLDGQFPMVLRSILQHQKLFIGQGLVEIKHFQKQPKLPLHLNHIFDFLKLSCQTSKLHLRFRVGVVRPGKSRNRWR